MRSVVGVLGLWFVAASGDGRAWVKHRASLGPADEFKLTDVCKSQFARLLNQEYPPLEQAALALHSQFAYGQRFPQWQPIGKPSFPSPGVWANVDEFQLTMPSQIILHSGFPSAEQYLSTWLHNMQAVGSGVGAHEFASRMQFVANPLGVRDTGLIIQSDLPTVGSPYVELADYEVVAMEATFFQLASLSVLGPADGRVYRESLAREGCIQRLIVVVVVCRTSILWRVGVWLRGERNLPHDDVVHSGGVLRRPAQHPGHRDPHSPHRMGRVPAGDRREDGVSPNDGLSDDPRDERLSDLSHHVGEAAGLL
jgi:hypothetical protein